MPRSASDSGSSRSETRTLVRSLRTSGPGLRRMVSTPARRLAFRLSRHVSHASPQSPQTVVAGPVGGAPRGGVSWTSLFCFRRAHILSTGRSRPNGTRDPASRPGGISIPTLCDGSSSSLRSTRSNVPWVGSACIGGACAPHPHYPDITPRYCTQSIPLFRVGRRMPRWCCGPPLKSFHFGSVVVCRNGVVDLRIFWPPPGRTHMVDAVDPT